MSNEKREQQIRSKAKELGQKYFPDEANVWARGNIEAEYVESACIEMAEWADQHPHWIPVEERLPKRMREGSRFSETVLVYNKAGFIDTTYYDYEENEWKWSPSVTHWMPIVPPRKEDKK